MVSPREEAGEGGIPRVALSPLTSTLSAQVGVSDFGRAYQRPNSGRPEVGCKRGEGSAPSPRSQI